ncbi:serine transporter [Bifidobacterium actinocoloniiforme DSM 22766]|uniref:Serine transporter n=1 Tax=Bifidobacterium actinocoloniiforme DSM 22766 TaxID=1437605 RepID=A0A086YYH1_9BIFI|nr:amino acid permease [Bifidobacterium actinocoloniiforme]KFI39321.1 serine transporter [Bifidobacterium actinocoloniiforme DSM 22766]
MSGSITDQANGVKLSSVEKHAAKAGMTVDEWKKATKFDGTDWGWVVMSIGMAIGAGIVFLPVKVGMIGLWVFLVSAVIAYPAMYLFQKLFINTLAESDECEDYPSVISGYLGKNWGFFLGVLYFLMLLIWVFVYSTAITNDSASYLHSFHITKGVWSDNPFYGLVIVIALVSIASRAEKVLFRISTFMVLTKLVIVAALGVVMIGMWNLKNVGAFPPMGYLVKQTIVLLPFTLTSILFIQSLSPMVISFRSHNKSVEVARYKALRAMNIAFVTLFVVVFFYAVSFNLALGHDQAVEAYEKNVSTLAIAAQNMPGNYVKILSLILNIFAVMTAFFGVFMGFKEACQGIATNVLKRFIPEDKINMKVLSFSILVFSVLVAWGAILLNAPVTSFTSICSPIFGMIGCLIPVYLVYKVPKLHKFKGPSLYLIIFVGILLVVSPFFAFL